ncbi:MAG: hypothetical protein ACI9LO_002252 [Planctomycetota bacterium]
MSDKLRNFDLTVEEIRLVKAIKELTESLENITFSDPSSPRSAFFRAEIESLEEKLEDIRDNTLIR